jgi:hypothetical protein
MHILSHVFLLSLVSVVGCSGLFPPQFDVN